MFFNQNNNEKLLIIILSPDIDAGLPIEGPLSPAVARIGQQIIETAIRSIERGGTVPLVEV